MVNFGFGNKKKKKSLKWKVVVKGVTISKHTTKTLAKKKAKGIYAAKVLSIGQRNSVRRTKRKRRNYY
mgnify:CR=1 FL=1